MEKARLGRLRGELEDMVGVFRPFGLGILRPLPAAIVSPRLWEELEEACEPHYALTDRHLHSPPSWPDPASDRTYCVRWWGDKEGVQEFKIWAQKVRAFLRQHPKMVSELYVPTVTPVLPSWHFSYEPYHWEAADGYYWTVNAFAFLAVNNMQMTRTKEHALRGMEQHLEVSAIPTVQHHLSDSPTPAPPVKMVFLEIEADAVTLGLRILDQFEGKLPPLRSDVEQGVIYVNDTPVLVDRELAKFVAILLAANGGWVSPAEIRNELGMSEDERIDRAIIKKLPKAVRDLVERKAGKGSRIVKV